MPRRWRTSPWYVPSLVPILVLAPLLASVVWWTDRRRWPLAAHALSIAAWAASILLAARPDTRDLGGRLLMVGFFLPATFLHVVARELGWRTRWVPAVYALGLSMTLAGAASEGLFLAAGGTEPGRWFLPMFGASFLVGAVPLGLLWRAQATVAPGLAERRRYLMLAGGLTSFGGGLNVLLMLNATFYPLGLYLVLSSLGLLTFVVRAGQLPEFGRFVERSQRYTLLAALLSTVWMFLLMATVQLSGSSAWTWQAALLLFVLTLTAQPLLTELRITLVDRLFPGRQVTDGIARALVETEARAEHAGRLAEIGTMAAAVAHEVRNPLGVITACLVVLERQGADREVLGEIRQQVDRAARFADELLAYGRPGAPVPRRVALEDLVPMAAEEVRRALTLPLEVRVEGSARVSADMVQVVQLFRILFENAALAAHPRSATCRVQLSEHGSLTRARVEDDGPGVPVELVPRLFQPFVSGRGRAGPRPGTGLGLAIARGVAQRHGGDLRYGGSAAGGGAVFDLELPVRPPWWEAHPHATGQVEEEPR